MKLPRTEQDWIGNEFRVKEAMTRMPDTVDTEEPLSSVKALMERHRVRYLPVLRSGDLVGLISDRDIWIAEALHGPGRLSAGAALSEPPYAVVPETPLAEVLQTMLELEIDAAVVLNPRGIVIGVFTTTDALAMLRALVLLGSRGAEEAHEKILMTERDYEALDRILQAHPHNEQSELLEGELARAEVVADEALPDNVVTLHSRARIVDETTSREREVTVVPPGSTGISEGRVSVLAPLGAAVIGLSEGQSIDWPLPSGQSRRFRVAKVLYQPEARRKASNG